MGTGSGLDGQFGIGEEAVVGTIDTIDRFYGHESAPLNLTPNYIESDAIQAGSTFRSIDNVAIASLTAGGKVVLPVTHKNMGLLWKFLIGSDGTVAADGTTAKKQIHTPGALRGKSFTAQVGKPEPATGTVAPRTYRGCKITDWAITIAKGEKVRLEFTIDAWDEDTATSLAAATYVASNPIWTFKQCSVFTIGGTASTASGETTISGGSAVTSVVTSLTLKGTNKLATERHGLGGSGIKKEQLQNGFTEIEGSFEGEFNPSQLETPFRNGDTVAFQIDLVGPEIETGKPYLLSFIIPAAKITECPADLDGPDLVTSKGTFKVYKDSLGNPAIQVKIRNTDTTI